MGKTNIMGINVRYRFCK